MSYQDELKALMSKLQGVTATADPAPVAVAPVAVAPAPVPVVVPEPEPPVAPPTREELQAAGISLTKESTAIFDNTVCVSVRLTGWGIHGHVGATDVTAGDAEPEMLNVQKLKLDSEEYKNIKKLDGEIREFLYSQCVKSIFKPGTYFVPLKVVLKVDGKLKDFAIERQALIDTFIAAYPQRIKEAATKLGGLYDPRDYPSADRIRQLFSMQWQFVEWGDVSRKLASISTELLREEQAKMRQERQEVAGTISLALAAEAKDIIDRFAGGLQDTSDGKKKRLYESTAKKFGQFMDDLDQFRNITDNPVLAEVAKRGRQIMAGVTVDDLRNDEGTLRQMIGEKARELSKDVDKFITTAKVRQINSGLV